VKEHLDYTYDSKEYHYTLYYYDQGANLVQTVPPKGVHPLKGLPLAKFFEGDETNPMHGLVTRYEYGAMNQVLKKSTPDAGVLEFHFDDKKRVRLSQNAQQKLDNQFSYTKYDEQGRVVEIGELYTAFEFEDLKDSLNLAHFPTDGHADYLLSDITKTHYDFERGQVISTFPQQFLRTRVAWMEVINKGATDTIATYYTYDVHGNVKALMQHIPGLPDKRMDYVYDLLSGKVNYVFYEYGKADQFVHRYTYDADNRIREVQTSSDRFIWHKEAAYEYYLHGSPARLELGPYRSQGLDYYYTLQGWIKGVNMPFAGDPGKDGGSESLTGKDVFSYALGYYENDYKPVNGSVLLPDTRDKMNTHLQQYLGYAGLYNGNISWMVTDLAKIGDIRNDRTKSMQGMMYRYDQLNRITKSRSLTDYSAAGGFAARPSLSSAYDENYSYDPNGNLLTLFRRNESGAQMDDFDYEYYSETNRLLRVRPTTTDTIYTGRVASNRIIYKDVILKDGAYVPTDVPAIVRGTENVIAQPDFGTEDGADFTAMITEDIPYLYDAIGNLILDQAEGVSISWTPYGKVREVRSHNDSVFVKFRYDAVGNRVEKRVEKPDTTLTTRYVRDPKGNVMTIYTDTTVIERFIYGSSRLGVYEGGTREGDQTLGYRTYELGNHLENVLSVITDNIGMNTADTVWATVVHVSDYYPFGMEMQGRTWSDTTELLSRYGFNGKEKDQGGEFGGVAYDYGFRIYNPSIGKFLSVDPLTGDYPWLTPYQFAANSPVMAIDLDGAEPQYMVDKQGKLTKPLISLLSTALNFDAEVLAKSKWVPTSGLIVDKRVYAQTGLSHKDKVEYDPMYGDLNKDDQKNFARDQEKLKKGYRIRTSDPWFDEFYSWAQLISHEEAHRQDYYSQGTDLWLYVYISIPSSTMESRAHFFGEGTEYVGVLDGKMKSNSSSHPLFGDIETYNILKSSTMSTQEKTDRLTLKGLRFRLDYLKTNKDLPFQFTDEEKESYAASRNADIKKTAELIVAQEAKVRQYDKKP
jgi:RHS repeat-associated protein